LLDLCEFCHLKVGFLKEYRLDRSFCWLSERRRGGPGLSLAAVRDLRVARAPVTAEDLAALQTDVLAGFVLARAPTGLSDGTIASDVVMRPAGVSGRLSPGGAARRGWTEGSHRRARSTRPGGY
jgi:hypothetical protein